MLLVLLLDVSSGVLIKNVRLVSVSDHWCQKLARFKQQYHVLSVLLYKALKLLH